VRIVFTERDLARVRLADTPHALSEVTFSMRALRRRDVPGFEPWRGQTRSRLTPQMKPLADLVPSRGWIPDFMEPAGGLSHARTALRAASGDVIRFDLARIAAERRPPPLALELAADRKQALERLAEAVTAYHTVALAPHWQRIAAAFEADRAARARILASGGLDLLLATLHPSLRWNPPVLELAGYRDGERLDLDGRGLLVNPGVLALYPRASVIVYPGSTVPVLVVPIWERPPLGGADADRGPAGGLAGLLGATRARVIRFVAAGCTTTELARALGIAPATASEHATVLRKSGLISTQRHRNTVLHTLTPLGTALIDANPADDAVTG
jgi:DNA-binding transcriptional ArsR family regulator